MTWRRRATAGACYTLLAPDPVADPIIDGPSERTGITLVDHPRVTFARGGLPGLEFAPRRPPELHQLKSDLLPI